MAKLTDEESEMAQKYQKDMLNVFWNTLKHFNKEELEDRQVIATKRYIELCQNNNEASAVAQSFLKKIVTAWFKNLQEMRNSFSSPGNDSLPIVKTQIAKLETHKKLLEQFTGDEAKYWHQIYFLTNQYEGARKDLKWQIHLSMHLSCVAYFAICSSKDVNLIEACIRSAYFSFTRINELHSILDNNIYSEIWVAISRTESSLDDALKKLSSSGVASNSFISSDLSRHKKTLGAATSGRIHSNEGDNFSHFDNSNDDGFFENHYENDHSVNPANGMPMLNGIGGVDIFGNSFGQSHDW